MSLAKFSMEALDQSFLEFLKKALKFKIFLVLAQYLKKSNSKTKRANEKNEVFLNRKDPMAPRSFY